VEPVALEPGEEPPAGPVRALTARIEQALAAVTLQAEQAEAHALVDWAQRIVSAQDEVPASPPSLVDEFALRRRLLAGYDADRVVGSVATGMAKGAEDALASIMVLAAMLLFPLTWTGVAAAVWLWHGMEAGVVAFALAPLTAYAALVFFERLDRIIGGARALSLFVFRRWAFLRLLAERHAIREEIVALGRAVETS